MKILESVKLDSASGCARVAVSVSGREITGGRQLAEEEEEAAPCTTERPPENFNFYKQTLIRRRNEIIFFG